MSLRSSRASRTNPGMKELKPKCQTRSRQLGLTFVALDVTHVAPWSRIGTLLASRGWLIEPSLSVTASKRRGESGVERKRKIQRETERGRQRREESESRTETGSCAPPTKIATSRPARRRSRMKGLVHSKAPHRSLPGHIEFAPASLAAQAQRPAW